MKNNSDVQKMLKDSGILFAITLIAGLVLGFVFQLTKEPIRIQKEKAIQAACAEVFPAAVSFEEFDSAPSGEVRDFSAANGVTIGTVYKALGADGAVAGYVMEVTSSQGYGGNIRLYEGITTEGTLNGVSILEIAETPGLGMKADSVLVPQFAGKTVSSFTYTKTGAAADNQIDAISGATITTEAVTNAVNAGLLHFEKDLKGGSGNE